MSSIQVIISQHRICLCYFFVAIYTAALGMLLGDDKLVFSRKPEIMADAAYVILTKPSHEFTGHFLMDEGLLREEGIKDFDSYIHHPGIL